MLNTALIEPITESGCHIYMGSVERNGYCRVERKGRRFLAHRLAYEYAKGPIPEGTPVCHKCDVNRNREWLERHG